MKNHRFIAVLVVLFGIVPVAAGGDDDGLLRMNTSFEIQIPSSDDADTPALRCMCSTLISRDREVPITTKRRILCESPIGPLAVFSQAEIETTGKNTTVLVDVDSGSWLRIADKPEIEPRNSGEDKWAWQTRLTDVRDHLVTIDSSTRIFDSYDAEVTDQARSVLWGDLKESDPTVAALVENLIESVSNCKHPYCMALTDSIAKWVYAGETHTSQEIEVQMIGGPSAEELDDHEDSSFEKGFGKWGRSFPDPPRLE